MSRFLGILLAAWLPAVALAALSSPASGAQLWLKDGRVLEGKLLPLSGLADIPKAPDPDGPGVVRSILMVNDELRWTFISKRQIREAPRQDATGVLERYRIRQDVQRAGRTVKEVGPFKAEPFDEHGYGRRILRMRTVRGKADIIQGITEITPLWTKIEGLNIVWDMRVATSSIQSDVLAKILARQTKKDDIDARKKLVRFYLQAEWYEEAYRELEKILADFSDDPQARTLEPMILSLKQLKTRRRLEELEMLADAGRQGLVREVLGGFPSEGVAGEILERVREMKAQYESFQAQYTKSLEQFDALLKEIKDEDVRGRIEPIRYEIVRELSINTLDRLSAFHQLLDDDSMLAEEKLSLAVSGWLLGRDSATVKLPVALSAYEVRGLVREYLNAGDTLTRAEILQRLRSQEGGTPSLVAKVLAHMKPPIDTPLPVAGSEGGENPSADAPSADAGADAAAEGGEGPAEGAERVAEQTSPPAVSKPGYYELEVLGLRSAPPVRYLVQLPPEYDPYRRYPAILTLHGGTTTPELQVDWWAGEWTERGWRRGQATRHGYIVIAPAWIPEHQKEYQYSVREHAAVLNCLWDACRRFAIDTDRVFLTGHSKGGDAAWDIGLARPHLWAGVIPIAARAERYCTHYWQNAKLVPFYCVGGELDGDRMVRNALVLDRCLRRGYNTTVVEFIGRGHENFSDEIQRLFDWMGRFKRDFSPKEFAVSTMRPRDNRFWWVELGDLPAARMVDPEDWPLPGGTRALETEAMLTLTNGVSVRRTGAGRVTVWLSPEMVDFERPMIVTVEGRRINPPSRYVEPDLEILLEDARRRADRQHPFWAKLER